MWHDYGYFEGDKLAKVYDLKLMKRLGRYCRPFLGILLLIAFLILAATAADLLLPYLTKIAIDRYIVVSARQVNIHPDLPPAIAEICDKYREYWEPSGKQGLYFLPNVKSSRIDLRDMARLRQAGVISEVPYYLIDIQSAAAMETARGHPELFEIFPNAAAIKVSDLARLDRSALLSIREKDLVGLGYLALLSIALLLVGYVFDFGQVILLEYTGQKLTLDLRQQLLEHVLNQSMAFHDRQSTGRLVARLTNDIQNLSEMIKTVAVTLFKDAFILVGIIIILVRTDLRLALVTFTVLPPILIITMVFRRKARDLFRRLRVIVGRINTAFSETIAGIRVVQAFRREKESAREFEELNHESFLAGLGQILVFATFMPIIEVFSAVALGLILWVGGLSVLQETITLGTVVVFISYSRKFFQPIRDMAEKFNILQSAMASLERIFGLMDTHQALPRVPAPVRTEKTKGSIVFENVRFAYKPNEPVLKDVSFEVKPGTTLAIVGATGSGKTSIINLLLRFYDLQSGRILVDGLDIRELDLVAHRSRMGLVMQDVFLFAGTIRENIAPVPGPYPAGSNHGRGPLRRCR